MRVFSNLCVMLLSALFLRAVSVARLTSGEDTAFVPSSEEDVQRLWAGIDVDVPTPKRSPWNALLSTEVGVEHSQRKVHVLGLQDTGTNLMFSILWQNFRDQLTFYDSTFTDSRNLRRSQVWKHANMKELAACSSGALGRLGAEGVTAIAMVRDPLSWMQSIRKAPYDFKACVNRKDWLSRSCLHRNPAGFAKCNNTEKASPPVTYIDLAQVWGKWNGAYSYLTRYGFADAIIVRYEDLVADPQAFIADLSSRMNLTLPSLGAQLVTKAAKTHGKAVGRGEALDKIKQRTYLSEFEDGELPDACMRIQRYGRLAQSFAYNDCDEILGRVAQS